MKRLLPLLVAAVGLFAAGGQPAARAAVPPGFVTRVGAQLQLDGHPYRFTGMNVYFANSDGTTCGGNYGSGSKFGEALTLMGSGTKAIRAWFFQSMAMKNGARSWPTFDHTLTVAANHGVKVIVTLGNQWADCELGAGYKDEAWYASGYKQKDPGGTESYRDWVAEIVSRYKDNPTILAWQLMNEAEVKPSVNAGCSTNAEALLEAFATDVSGLIKSIDPNHLVSLGTMGGGQCGAQGDEYRQLHAVPTIDLCEYHDYDPTAAIPGDQWNGLQVRFNQCAALNKPLFVGEMGILPGDVGGLQPRADVVRQKFRAQIAAGSVGEMVWAWDETNPQPDNFNVARSDPLLRVLAGAFNTGIQAIGAGDGHTCAIDANGGLFCWGDNTLGDLGDVTTDMRNRPVAVTGIASGAVSVRGGESHTCAALTTGAVKCWGEDNDGQVGTGITVTHYTTPQDVSGVSTARAVAAEGDHSCALLQSGAAKCWGNSGNGELGSGYPIGGAQPTPQDVLLTEPAQALEAGWSHTCAVTVAGGAKCWGSPYFVGDGDSTNTSPRSRPVDVNGMTSGVTAIAPGMGHSCALSITGVKCWGFDSEGELGNGMTSSYPPAWSPVPVTGLPDGIQGIASGAHHTCAIKPNGGLVCWGENTYGQLGNNSTNNSSAPVPVSGLGSGVIAVTAGRRHTCALLDTGVVKCWGENAFGQLGRGPGGNSLVPVKVDFVDHIEPNDPSDVNQYQPASTVLAVGATADAPGVVFKAIVAAPAGGPTQLRLEVEIKPVGVPFNGQTTIKGPLVSAGSTASATASGLVRGQSYHWRARTVDSIGVTSQWVDFAGNPDSSPDFRLETPIIFSSNRDVAAASNELYSMNANGTGVVRLTTTNATNTEPSLSPDGTRIAFRGVDPTDGDFEIYVMNLDGSNRVNLTDNAAADQAPSWSPDGSRIAFVSNRAAGGAYNIWVMNADGSSPTQLTTTSPSNDNYPSWSPDGSKIAFMSARLPGLDIYVMNSDGTNQTRLGWNSSFDESFPDWSPDATKIAFASKRFGGQYEIFVGNADGSGAPTRLTTKARDDVFPQWSRTGARILFQGFDPTSEADAEIYRVAATGGTLARIGPNNTFADQSPTW